MNAMTAVPGWVNDYCKDGSAPINDKHARGLLKLHQTCTPPCPRKQSAERYAEGRDLAAEARH